MSARKKCSRDDCPRANIAADLTAKCGRCGEMVHLPCIGIRGKLNDVLIHPSMRVFCGECSENYTVGSHTVTAPVTISKTTFDSVLSILTDVQNVVRDTNEKVTASATLQGYADVLKKMDEVKELTVKTNEKLDAPKALALRNLDQFPRLGSPAKRKRPDNNNNNNEQPPPPPPRASAKKFTRTLTSGTSSVVTHGLGEAVQSKPRLEKAIYVTKLPVDITIDALTDYIKKREESVNDNDFSLRMLVKKDADLSTRTFLSCRLACTDALYEKFTDSSFWPPHVMIGEFIERPRPPRLIASADDFRAPLTETNVSIPITPTNPPTPSSKNGSSPSKMEVS